MLGMWIVKRHSPRLLVSFRRLDDSHGDLSLVDCSLPSDFGAFPEGCWPGCVCMVVMVEAAMCLIAIQCWGMF
jgi:hypothetical protein